MGKNTRTAFINGVDIGSGESEKRYLQVDEDVDVDNLNLIASRDTTSYDVNIYWCDANFNEIKTESVASGVTSGNDTTASQTVRSRYAKVEVADAGSGSGTANLTAFLE